MALPIGACVADPERPVPAGAVAAGVRPIQVDAPIVLPRLRAEVEAEVAAMRAIIGRSAEVGRTLSEANRALQTAAYFRKIPGNPALEALQATLRQAAEAAGLRVRDLRVALAAAPHAPLRPQLGVAERWSLAHDDLIGRINVRIEVAATDDAIAAFVDALPLRLERLLRVTQLITLADGVVAIVAEAYFEQPVDVVAVRVSWPTLDEWLRAAGHDPASAHLIADPELAALRRAVLAGRELLPDARAALISAYDLPRWPARARALARTTEAVAATRGDALVAALRGRR